MENINIEISKYILHTRHNKNTEEITLNYPSRLNALSYDMSLLIHNIIKNYIHSNEINQNLSFLIKDEIKYGNHINNNIPKVIILSSIGGKSFCSGGSLYNLYEYKQNNDYDKLISFYDYELTNDYYIQNIDSILISIWDGYVMGGGVGISVNSKIRIATENTVFAMPETSIGFFPDVGAGYFLTRMFNNNSNIGLYCGLTGYRLKGIDSVKAGAATHYIKRENIEKLKLKIIEETTIHNNQINLEKISRVVEDFSEYIYSPNDFYFENAELISKIFLFDSLKNIFDRLEIMSISDFIDEKVRKWTLETLEILKKMSPQALLIFFEYAKRALDYKDITECYECDRKLFGKLINDKEFFEGIRAVVIDKDRNPKWKHNSIKDINNIDEFLKFFFD